MYQRRIWDHGMDLPVSLYFHSVRDSSIILFGKQPVKTPWQSVRYDFWSYGSIFRYWDKCKTNKSISWFVTTSWRDSSVTKSRILFSIACTELHVQALHFSLQQLFDSIKSKRAFEEKPLKLKIIIVKGVQVRLSGRYLWPYLWR